MLFKIHLNIIPPFTLCLPSGLCIQISAPNVCMHLSFLRNGLVNRLTNPSWFEHPNVIGKKHKSQSFSLLFLYHLSKSLSYISPGLPVVASLHILRPKFCTFIMSLSWVLQSQTTKCPKPLIYFACISVTLEKGQFYIRKSLSIKALTKPNVKTTMNIAIRRREISCCSLKSLCNAALSSLLLFPLF